MTSNTARTFLYGGSLFALTLMTLTASPAIAAPAAPLAADAAEDASEEKEIVITGSLIAGTAKNTAIPVQVVTQDDLQKQGAPTVLEVIKQLPVVGGVFGDSNQFNSAAGNRMGGGTLNLRGLGPQRTLVLLNGRRFAGPTAYGADTNLIPEAAIGRVEILKDGAAATYGSDAIGGVVNFLTRTNFRGLELNADYRRVPGSKGDYTASGLWGWANDHQNLLVSFGYQHRSELSNMDRGFTQQPYNVNPSPWSSLGNPGSFTVKSAANGAGTTLGLIGDANCSALGGAAGYSGNTPICRFNYLPYTNLVEDQNQYQAYAEFNSEIGESSKFHAEAMYSRTDLPHVRFSPSYAPTNGVSGPGGSTYVIPASNPGFTTFLTQTGNAALIGVAQSALTTLWRPLGEGGNPATGGLGGKLGSRNYDEFHASAGFRGDTGIAGFKYDVSGTFIRQTEDQQTTDILINRLQSALNGLGGPNCTGTTAGANGCQYFNPFSNAVPVNPGLGLTNPGYVSANANSPSLISWLFDNQRRKSFQNTYIADASLSGNLPITLPGGPVVLAIGAQYRRTDFRQTVPNPNYNSLLNPCPTLGSTSCAFQTGPYTFLSQTVPLKLSQTVYAFFGELNLPVTDRLNAQASLRYENYGGQIGSTTNPQFRAKWKLFDFLSFRGSVGTSFRGPTPQESTPAGGTLLTSIAAIGGGFRPVDNFGNANLKPETATTYSLGAIIQERNFTATIDYYHYKVKNQITTVPVNIIATGVAGPGNGSQFVNCASPLRGLITFDTGNTCTQGTTTANNISRVRSDTTNGPALIASGIDAELNYHVPDVLGGSVNLGANLSYVLKFNEGAFVYQGITVLAAYAAAGYSNYDRFPGTIAKLRGQFFAEYHLGRHNLRWTVNYIDGVKDNRGPTVVQTGPSTNCNAANQLAGTAINCQLITFGLNQRSFISNDIVYRVELPWGTTATFSLLNAFDRKPSRARLELSYDPLIGNPLGRTFKIGLRKEF